MGEGSVGLSSFEKEREKCFRGGYPGRRSQTRFALGYHLPSFQPLGDQAERCSALRQQRFDHASSLSDLENTTLYDSI